MTTWPRWTAKADWTRCWLSDRLRTSRLNGILLNMKIAAIQMRSGLDPDANIAALEPMLAQAVEQGATYVLTPEVTVLYPENRDHLRSVAAPFEDSRKRLGALRQSEFVMAVMSRTRRPIPNGKPDERACMLNCCGVQPQSAGSSNRGLNPRPGTEVCGCATRKHSCPRRVSASASEAAGCRCPWNGGLKKAKRTGQHDPT